MWSHSRSQRSSSCQCKGDWLSCEGLNLILQTLLCKAVQSSAMGFTDWLCCIRRIGRSMRGIRRCMVGEGGRPIAFFLKSTTHHFTETYLISSGNHRWSISLDLLLPFLFIQLIPNQVLIILTKFECGGPFWSSTRCGISAPRCNYTAKFRSKVAPWCN